jgi:hypothetical protein
MQTAHALKQTTHFSQLNQTLRMTQTRFSHTHTHPPAASLNSCGGSSNSNNSTNSSSGVSIQQAEQTQEIVRCCIANATRYKGILRSSKCVIRVPIRRLCKSMRAQVPKGTLTMHFAICMYMYMYIFVSVYAYIYLCMHVCMYIHIYDLYI